MTHLRKIMLEELERRNHSEGTKRTYVQTIKDVARYFKPRPPDQLGPADIREYQAYLFRERKLSPNTVNQRTGALRFFFIMVLKKPWSIAETPYPSRHFRLRKVLSQQQVAKLNPLPLLSTGDSYDAVRDRAPAGWTGAPTVSDIDSQQMTPGTMPVATGITWEGAITRTRALIHVAAQRGRAAALDRGQYFQVQPVQPGTVSVDEAPPCGADYIGHLQWWPYDQSWFGTQK